MVTQTLHTALMGSGTDRNKAIASLVDRGSAKKGREGGTEGSGSGAPIDSRLLELMTGVIDHIAEKLPKPPKEIAAPRGDIQNLPDGGTYDGNADGNDGR